MFCSVFGDDRSDIERGRAKERGVGARESGERQSVSRRVDFRVDLRVDLRVADRLVSRRRSPRLDVFFWRAASRDGADQDATRRSSTRRALANQSGKNEKSGRPYPILGDPRRARVGRRTASNTPWIRRSDASYRKSGMPGRTSLTMDQDSCVMLNRPSRTASSSAARLRDFYEEVGGAREERRQ